MELPMHVKIGAFDFAIEYDDRLEENSQLGRINLTGGTIGIRPDMAISLERMTIMHEILHGIMFTAGIRDLDESLVNIMAHGITQVLKDNQKLFK
jgi:hypothetical protein